MSFKVGETVVYPHHGAALIEAIETRTIKGEDRLYLVLKVAQGDLTAESPPTTSTSSGFETSSDKTDSIVFSRSCAPPHRRADQLVAQVQGQSREAR